MSGGAPAGSPRAPEPLDPALGDEAQQLQQEEAADAGGEKASAPRLAVPGWAAKLGRGAAKIGQGAKEAIAKEVRLMAEDVNELKTGVKEGAKVTAKDAKALQEKLARDAMELTKNAKGFPGLLKAQASSQGEGQEARDGSASPTKELACEAKEQHQDATGLLAGPCGATAGASASDEAARAAEKVRKMAQKTAAVSGDWWRTAAGGFHHTAGGLRKGLQQAAANLGASNDAGGEAEAGGGPAPPFSPPERGAGGLASGSSATPPRDAPATADSAGATPEAPGPAPGAGVAAQATTMPDVFQQVLYPAPSAAPTEDRGAGATGGCSLLDADVFDPQVAAQGPQGDGEKTAGAGAPAEAGAAGGGSLLDVDVFDPQVAARGPRGATPQEVKEASSAAGKDPISDDKGALEGGNKGGNTLEAIEAELDDIFESIDDPSVQAPRAPVVEDVTSTPAKVAEAPARVAEVPAKVADSSFDDLWDSIMEEDDM